MRSPFKQLTLFVRINFSGTKAIFYTFHDNRYIFPIGSRYVKVAVSAAAIRVIWLCFIDFDEFATSAGSSCFPRIELMSSARQRDWLPSVNRLILSFYIISLWNVLFNANTFMHLVGIDWRTSMGWNPPCWHNR